MYVIIITMYIYILSCSLSKIFSFWFFWQSKNRLSTSSSMLCLSLEDLHSHNHRISAKKVFTAGFLYTSFPYPLEWHSSTMARLISEVIQTQKSSTSFCCCFNRICKIVFHPFRLKSPFLRSHRCLFCCRMNESSATTKKNNKTIRLYRRYNRKVPNANFERKKKKQCNEK